jgi:hypothetical protein
VCNGFLRYVNFKVAAAPQAAAHLLQVDQNALVGDIGWLLGCF